MLAGSNRPALILKPLGHKRVTAAERKVQKQLGKGMGILKVAKSLGIGTGTVQRIANERR